MNDKTYPSPDPNLTDEEYDKKGGFCERLLETSPDHQGLVVIAPHGGMIEPGTAEQAKMVYDLLTQGGKSVTCWLAKGRALQGGSFAAYHVPSSRIALSSFPLLDRIEDRQFAYSLAFHGCKVDFLTIGGRAPLSFKDEIGDAIFKATQGQVPIVLASSGPYGGVGSRNVLNRLGGSSIQIEEPALARNKYREAIAKAIAGVYAEHL